MKKLLFVILLLQFSLQASAAFPIENKQAHIITNHAVARNVAYPNEPEGLYSTIAGIVGAVGGLMFLLAIITAIQGSADTAGVYLAIGLLLSVASYVFIVIAYVNKEPHSGFPFWYGTATMAIVLGSLVVSAIQ